MNSSVNVQVLQVILIGEYIPWQRFWNKDCLNGKPKQKPQLRLGKGYVFLNFFSVWNLFIKRFVIGKFLVHPYLSFFRCEMLSRSWALIQPLQRQKVAWAQSCWFPASPMLVHLPKLGVLGAYRSRFIQIIKLQGFFASGCCCWMLNAWKTLCTCVYILICIYIYD